MSARAVALLLALVLAHALAPYAVVVAAALVVLFALTCIGLGFLLGATRHTWGGAALARRAGAP